MINKKSQITVFIIIGMIAVAAAGLFFYYKSATAEKKEIISPEAVPIKNFVEDCMYTIAKDGITVLGLNGGYIDFPYETANNPLSYLSIGPIPANPYWWYEGIDNIPTEEEIKQQISEHVNSQLKACIDDFKSFEDIFTIREKGNIVTRTYLNEEDVTVEVSYPIDIISTVNKTKTNLVNFRSAIPIRLKKAYELAKAIMERENIDAFIEEKTIDLMAMSSEDDIPLNHVEFDCGNKEWLVSDIKNKLKELLRRNIQFIKIAGTNYNDKSYIPIPDLYSDKQTFDESYYNYHYVWTVMEEPPEDMHASFTFDEAWPMDIYARPSKGNKLVSNAQKGFNMLRLFCLHTWHFTYDVSFPVLATIKDDKAGSHDEFSFVFAFKANIDHNQPARKSLTTSVFPTPDRASTEEYCSELDNEVSIFTEDKMDTYPITDVNLTFVCGGFNCPIGVSEWLDDYGGSAGITTKFPYCVQAIIKGNAEGYDESQKIIQTNLEGKSYILYMTPVKLVSDYTVVKHSFDNNVVDPAEHALEGDEKATITITRIEEDFSSFGAYPIPDQYPIKFLAKDDFKYELEIYLIKNSTIIGGYKGNWTITEEEIENLDGLKFHVIEMDAENDMERYAFVEGLTSYSKKAPKPEAIVQYIVP